MTMNQNCEHDDATLCGECGTIWCATCDPCPWPLCHVCHGRGYTTADRSGEPSNATRAARVASVVAAYAEKVGGDDRDTASLLVDLLTDLQHAADVYGIDWDWVTRVSAAHHDVEVQS